MKEQPNPFWVARTLDEMSREQWESLCDRCGICCLQKIEDKKTGVVKPIGVACEFLETESCQCLVYENRHRVNPECVALSPANIKHKKWLPDSCAYRRIAEGRQLEQWHHLISGDPDTVHRAGISVREKVVSGRHVHPEDIDVD